MSHHEFDVPAGSALARSFEFKNDEGARAHRAADGGARHGGLAQHARRRKQALFDDGIDQGWGAPLRLAPQLAHAFETAHEIVHGDTGGMNAGELAALSAGTLAPADLEQAYQAAMALDARELAGKFAAELVGRPPYPERPDRFTLYQLLIGQALGHDPFEVVCAHQREELAPAGLDGKRPGD